MRSKVEDTTASIQREHREQWQRYGNVDWRLITELYGTFCFAVEGSEEGCGDPLEVTLTRTTQLTGTFSVKVVSIAYSTTSSVAQKLTHQTGPCEACRGVACYRRSRLREYAFRTRIRHSEWREAQLFPGTGLLLTADCAFEPECAGCSDANTKSRQRSIASVKELSSNTACYVTMSAFHGLSEGSDEDPLSVGSDVVESFGRPLDDSGGTTEVPSVLVAQQGGLVVGLDGSDEPGIALLSVGDDDVVVGGVRRPDAPTLPVFAAATALPEPSASARILRLSGDPVSWPLLGQVGTLDEFGFEAETLSSTKLLTSVGRFTTLVGAIDQTDLTSIGSDEPLALAVELRSRDNPVGSVVCRIVR